MKFYRIGNIVKHIFSPSLEFIISVKYESFTTVDGPDLQWENHIDDDYLNYTDIFI